jgi:hypothetical protein
MLEEAMAQFKAGSGTLHPNAEAGDGDDLFMSFVNEYTKSHANLILNAGRVIGGVIGE